MKECDQGPRWAGARCVALAATLLATSGAFARDTLDELAALTDETIRSACHGYVLEDIADRLAGWFGSTSPLCRAVSAGEPPQAVIASLRGHGVTAPAPAGTAEFRSLPDPIAMECHNDARCMIERRRARDLGQPMDMATFLRVRSHCEQTAPRVYGVAQGVEGCIEHALADWPVLRLTRPVRLLPMQGEFEVVGGAELREAAQASAPLIAPLEPGRPLEALARSEDGQWLQVRDVLSGAKGFVQTASLRRAAAVAPDSQAPAVAAAPSPSLDIDALVRSGAVDRRHHQNELERLEQQRREEETRLAAERERLAREQAERERLAALQRQREQAQAVARQRPDAADGFMRGLAGAAVVGLGAAAVSRGVPMDRAAEVVGAGLADIASGGESGHSVRVLEQAQRQGDVGSGGGAGTGVAAAAPGASPAASARLLPNALDAAGRPRYRDCTLFRNPTGFDALALARMCNAAEQSYQEYERVVRSGADDATAQRAWEAHRDAAVNLMVFIDSQGTAKQANGF